MRCHPAEFALKPPPYEYEFERTPLDLILGSSTLRHRLAAGDDLLALEAAWQGELAGFDAMRRSYFLYR